jgi:(2Fe-2S) ferredoxin
VCWGDWSVDTDLLAAVDLLRRPEDVDCGAPEDVVTPPESDREPLLLVCAHGLHDTCCAVRGRPVAAILATRWPNATWECTHLGGDRFAPNVLVLPDGTYYGALDAELAVGAIEQHLAGRLAVDHLRGLATMPPPAQAAAAALHRTFGPWSPTAVRLGQLESAGPTGPWVITVDSPLGPRQARVTASRRPAARLTCQAVVDTTATHYDVVWVTDAGVGLGDAGERDRPRV